MEHVVEDIPSRAFRNHGRLVYLTHPDSVTSNLLGDEFIAKGYEVSLVAAAVDLVPRMAIRRPDIVVMVMCNSDGAIDEALVALDAICTQHLGVVAILLAPASLRAELVVQAIKRGASAVFSAPYAPMEIIAAAGEVICRDVDTAAGNGGFKAAAATGFSTLTRSEQQILQYVISGSTSKEIAGEIGISVRTVEVHRQHIMEKFGARNSAELVRLAIESRALGLPIGGSSMPTGWRRR